MKYFSLYRQHILAIAIVAGALLLSSLVILPVYAACTEGDTSCGFWDPGPEQFYYIGECTSPFGGGIDEDTGEWYCDAGSWDPEYYQFESDWAPYPHPPAPGPGDEGGPCTCEGFDY